jgi:hypothetical protein
VGADIFILAWGNSSWYVPDASILLADILTGQTLAKVNLILVSAGPFFVGTFISISAWILLEVPFTVQMSSTLILRLF